MELRYEVETGWPDGLELRRRVAAYGRLDRVLGFKVGITCDPSNRAAQYRYRDPHYKEMVIIYKTRSDPMVRNIEREMTDWFDDDPECDNYARGGGGPRGSPPYYLYVVLRERI